MFISKCRPYIRERMGIIGVTISIMKIEISQKKDFKFLER